MNCSQIAKKSHVTPKDVTSKLAHLGVDDREFLVKEVPIFIQTLIFSLKESNE